MLRPILIIAVLPALYWCTRKPFTSAPPPAADIVRTHVDTLYDTLRYFAKVNDTIRLERTILAIKYDTIHNLIQISQVVKTPVRTDTVRLTQYVITQEPTKPNSTALPKVWLVGIAVLVVLTIFVTLRLWARL